MFCKHDWEKVVDDYTASFAERYNGKFEGYLDMMQGTKIIILKCNKCGKLDKTIERV